MATYNLGQVAIVNKGAWASGTSYAPLNVVSHNSGSFMAIAANTSKEPGVASDWTAYWMRLSNGIKTVTVTAISTTQAQVSVTFSDGTTAVAGTYNTSGIPAGSVGTDELDDGGVTAAKLGSDILPSNVGIKMGTATPTTSTISEGQIYLKYT